MIQRIGPTNARLLHACLGICTEAGELNDAIKKALVYGKLLDRTNLIEELGDLMWYIAIACDNLEVDLGQVMQTNIDKLRARFPEKFTEDKALNRDLDAERDVLEHGRTRFVETHPGHPKDCRCVLCLH